MQQDNSTYLGFFTLKQLMILHDYLNILTALVSVKEKQQMTSSYFVIISPDGEKKTAFAGWPLILTLTMRSLEVRKFENH